MLLVEPKLADVKIEVTWNALALLRSYVNRPGEVLTECTMTCETAPRSIADGAAAQMISGAAIVNSVPVINGSVTYPPGTLVTQTIEHGVEGAVYIITTHPVGNTIGAFEGDQIRLDVVEFLPPQT